MRIPVLVMYTLTLLLAGCGTLREEMTSGEPDDVRQNFPELKGLSSATVSDSIHQGSTWKGERDSVKSQVRWVTLAIIIAAMVLLVFTLGTAARGA